MLHLSVPESLQMDDFTALLPCFLVLISPLSFFFLCVLCFRSGRAEGSSRCCCPGIAKQWEEGFPFVFTRVSAEAPSAVV